MPLDHQTESSLVDAGVVLLAAGDSTRMGGDKMLFKLSGKPVFEYSLDVFQRCQRVGRIVVVASESNFDAVTRLVSNSASSKVLAVVKGGKRRQDSMANGVERLGEGGFGGIKWVLVHDGARPFVDEEMIMRGLQAAEKSGAAAPAVPVTDTIRDIGDDGVGRSIDRSRLRAIQTPQVMSVDILLPVLRTTHDVTDDVALIELAGGTVGLFDGSPDNIKLTTRLDIDRAESIVRRRAIGSVQHGYRWGTGFDGHAFAAGGPLRLGGVDIDHGYHLKGHSDGDVLLHAITSSILGAAGLGDMGANFPSNDLFYSGIDSSELLDRAVKMSSSDSWEPSFVDATIIAQQPKLAPYVDRITESIAEMLSLSADSVNIKITSTDHVGAIGRGEGIAAQAIATLVCKIRPD